jgi:hypothetical protein
VNNFLQNHFLCFFCLELSAHQRSILTDLIELIVEIQRNLFFPILKYLLTSFDFVNLSATTFKSKSFLVVSFFEGPQGSYAKYQAPQRSYVVSNPSHSGIYVPNPNLTSQGNTSNVTTGSSVSSSNNNNAQNSSNNSISSTKNSSGSNATKINIPCKYFKVGTCKLGDQCKYLHITPKVRIFFVQISFSQISRKSDFVCFLFQMF